MARKRTDDDDDDDDPLVPEDLKKPITPPDCDKYENIAGTAWGANGPAAKAQATADAKAVCKTLKLRCPKSCPFPKKDWTVNKPKPNTIVLPLWGISITIGWVCDWEVIYGCFTTGEV